jgi:hypothetical protein
VLNTYFHFGFKCYCVDVVVECARPLGCAECVRFVACGAPRPTARPPARARRAAAQLEAPSFAARTPVYIRLSSDSYTSKFFVHTSKLFSPNQMVFENKNCVTIIVLSTKVKRSSDIQKVFFIIVKRSSDGSKLMFIRPLFWN